MSQATKPEIARAMTLRRSKTGIIFPKAIVERLNLAPDWSMFHVHIVEGGLFLELVDKRNCSFR